MKVEFNKGLDNEPRLERIRDRIKAVKAHASVLANFLKGEKQFFVSSGIPEDALFMGMHMATPMTLVCRQSNPECIFFFAHEDWPIVPEGEIPKDSWMDPPVSVMTREEAVVPVRFTKDREIVFEMTATDHVYFERFVGNDVRLDGRKIAKITGTRSDPVNGMVRIFCEVKPGIDIERITTGFRSTLFSLPYVRRNGAGELLDDDPTLPPPDFRLIGVK